MNLTNNGKIVLTVIFLLLILIAASLSNKSNKKANNVLNAKYISDISFSSNDYALNNLLTLLPQKIYIHLANSYEDEFINTLKLIFNDRIFICKDCDICRLYSINTIEK